MILRAQAVAVLLTAPLGISDVLAARWTPAPVLSLLILGAFGTGVAFVFWRQLLEELAPHARRRQHS